MILDFARSGEMVIVLPGGIGVDDREPTICQQRSVAVAECDKLIEAFRTTIFRPLSTNGYCRFENFLFAASDNLALLVSVPALSAIKPRPTKLRLFT